MRKRFIFGLALVATLCLTACHNTPKDPEKPIQPTAQADAPQDPLALLNDSIAQDENRADLYLRRATLYVEREQIGQAMMDVNKSIQLDPNNVDALLLLADIYYLLGDEVNITVTAVRQTSAGRMVFAKLK